MLLKKEYEIELLIFVEPCEQHFTSHEAHLSYDAKTGETPFFQSLQLSAKKRNRLFFALKKLFLLYLWRIANLLYVKSL